MDDSIPITLGIISGYIGSDSDLVETLKEGYDAGLFEFAYHGFGNENLSQMDYQEQKSLVMSGIDAMKEVFGEIELVTFIPPMHEFNQDTITVCNELGFRILSSNLRRDPPPWETSLKHFPETVISARYVNGSFLGVDIDETYGRIQESVETYGFAVITLHPQQFSDFDEELNYIGLNLAKLDNFKALLDRVASSFQIKTIADLGGYVEKEENLFQQIPTLYFVIPIIFVPLLLIYIVYYARARKAKGKSSGSNEKTTYILFFPLHTKSS